MKQYYTICFCFAINFAVAQHATISNNPLEFHPGKFPKSTIYLENDSSIHGTIMKITDSILMIAAYPNDTTNNKSFFEIAVTRIKRIKIKTDIGLSMAGGAILAGFAGYGLGYITYHDNYSISDQDNRDNQKVRGALGALIAAVPGAFIGMVTGLFHKQNFVINGNKEKMQRLIHALK